jgi:hypothetical protein
LDEREDALAEVDAQPGTLGAVVVEQIEEERREVCADGDHRVLRE